MRFNLRSAKSCITILKVQACDATDASFLFYCLAKKKFLKTLRILPNPGSGNFRAFKIFYKIHNGFIKFLSFIK